MEDKTFEAWYAAHQNELAGMTHQERALAAFKRGVEAGMARSRNYAADRVEEPTQVTFFNGRKVKLAGPRDGANYLDVLEAEESEKPEADKEKLICEYCGDRAYTLMCNGQYSGGHHKILNRP